LWSGAFQKLNYLTFVPSGSDDPLMITTPTYIVHGTPTITLLATNMEDTTFMH